MIWDALAKLAIVIVALVAGLILLALLDRDTRWWSRGVHDREGRRGDRL